jgi:hypothetical protein
MRWFLITLNLEYLFALLFKKLLKILYSTWACLWEDISVAETKFVVFFTEFLSTSGNILFINWWRTIYTLIFSAEAPISFLYPRSIISWLVISLWRKTWIKILPIFLKKHRLSTCLRELSILPRLSRSHFLYIENLSLFCDLVIVLSLQAFYVIIHWLLIC